MNQDSNKPSLEHSIVFPLTLSEAIYYLADQIDENIPSVGRKRNQINNKTWQQLSVRLRLIFNDFPKTLYRKTIEINYNADSGEIIGDCLQHELSRTKLNSLIKKLRYIYCAVTMCYIQDKESPFSSNDIPQKWIQERKDAKIELFDFADGIEKITANIPKESLKEDRDIKEVSLDGLQIKTIIKLLDDSEKLVNTTYDYVKNNCISHQKLRSLLIGIDEYSDMEVYIHLYQKFRKFRVERKLRRHFEEYDYFYKDYMLLESIYDKAPEFIYNSSMESKYARHPALIAMWDNISQTETEVSKLEFEFFSYLLKNIPTRKKEEKHNITNQLSYGKWDNLSVEVRNKIVDYIIQMSSQPKRIARFLYIETSDDDAAIELMDSQIEDICLQIRFPHRYNAYCDLKSLYSQLIEKQEIFCFEKLEDNIKKLSKIQKDLQKAVKKSVQNKQ